MQTKSGQPNPADAVRRVLTLAGVTGAALTLSAAAALPAFAGQNGDGNADQSQRQAQTPAAGSQDSNEPGGSQDGNAGSDSKDTETKGSGSDQNQGGQTGGHNPPGNNGTVKIHQVAGDSSPHNVPHVTCDFYVSFFGFDNNQTLNVSFTGQAPTGKDTPIAITGSGLSSKTSTTDAGGAGNDYDGDLGAYNASNLDLSGLGAPSKQGYHIKLDVSTGEPGGHKYKVLWFSPCGTQSGGTQSGGTQSGGNQSGDTTDNGGSTSTGTTTGTTTGTGTGSATVLGESITRGATGATTASGPTPAKPITASVLGESIRRPTPGLASLPFTGTETGVLSALGLAALGGGAALTVAGRRRKAAARA